MLVGEVFLCFFSMMFFFAFLLGGLGGLLYLQHMEVPRPGVKSELQLPAHAIATATPEPSHICDLNHSS